MALVGPSPDRPSPHDHYLFQRQEYVDVEGTGLSSIVIALRGQHALPNRHNTERFPKLVVEIYVDPPRNEARNPTGRTAEATCEEVFLVLDRVLHRPDGVSWQSNSTRISQSHRVSELEIMDVPDGDGKVRGTVNYALCVG